MKQRSVWVFVAVLWIAQSANAGLKSLELSTDLSPVILLDIAFSPFVHDYSVTVDSTNVKTLRIGTVVDSAADVVTINGMPNEGGKPYQADLKPGENRFAIVVTSSGGKPEHYGLTVMQKDLSGQYKTELVQEGVWRIADYFGFPPNQDMYLIEGTTKAILIDAGMGKGDLAGIARNLTSLPIELAVTHGHGDHIGQIGPFTGAAVYMSEKDRGMLPKTIDTSRFHWVKDGDRIELGGGRSLEVIEVPGHTAGSIMFLDRFGKTLAIGDAIGSGMYVWMFFPGAPSLAEYRKTLERLESRLSGMDSLTFLTGHHWQEKTPLTGTAGKRMVTDMKTLCDKIMRGEITGTPAPSNFGGGKLKILAAEYGLAGIWYNPDNILRKK